MPKKENIKILFVSAEVAPFAKVGGLADVAGALPPALKELGVDIRIMMPLHGSIKKILTEKKYKIKKSIPSFTIKYASKKEKIGIYETRLDNVPVYFIDHKFFKTTKTVYGNEDKFLFFSKAVAELIAKSRRDETPNSRRVKPFPNPACAGRHPLKWDGAHAFPALWHPDIVHCNDNHTALIPVLLKEKNSSIKTVLTIHNLEFQGQFLPKKLEALTITAKNHKTLAKDATDGDINKMAQGILIVNAITTVSPTYAKEILTKEYGEGLDNILKMRKKDLYGIINGIDTKNFNPETDPNIKYNYSVKNLKGKEKCKEALVKEYFNAGLAVNKTIAPIQGLTPPSRGEFARQSHKNLPPLIGLVSRLAPQKGIDLVIEALPRLFKKHPETLFILLGTGEPQYEEKLKELGKKYPNNFKPLITFNIKIAQQIYSASDIFLMPSKFEPCGLGQLIAMRYGSVPVARKTGGLADTINNFQFSIFNFQKNKNMNGFLFQKYSSKAMLKTLDEALKIYKDKKEWKKIMLNGMRRNSSWTASAKKYLEIYKKTVARIKSM